LDIVGGKKMKPLRKILSGILAAGTIMLLGCASNPTPAEEDAFRKMVEETFETYSDANMNGDADTYMALWDENSIKMGPGKPAVFGKKAIDEGKRKSFSTNVIVSQIINVEETKVSGSLGFARGTYTAIIKPKAGGTTANVDGKFLTIFRKQSDGSWKIFRDCYNSN
jgi:uncharacterized protein (TIGR02246 family)